MYNSSFTKIFRIATLLLSAILVSSCDVVGPGVRAAPAKPEVLAINDWASVENNKRRVTAVWKAVKGRDKDGKETAATYRISWNEGQYEDATPPVYKSFPIDEDVSVRVKAIVGENETESDPATVPKSQAAAPSSLAISKSATTRDFARRTMTVSWTAPEDPGKSHTGEPAALTFRVHYAEGDTVTTSSPFITTNHTSATIGNRDSRKSYSVLVVAVNNGGLSSEPANVDEVKDKAPATEATGPDTPTITTTRDFAANTITVQWTKPTNPGTLHDGSRRAEIAHYNLYYAEGDSVTAFSSSVPVTGTRGVIRNADDDKSYSVLVEAVNSAGIPSRPAKRTVAASERRNPDKPVVIAYNDWSSIEDNKRRVQARWLTMTGKDDHGTTTVPTYRISWNGGAYEDGTSPETRYFPIGQDVTVKVKVVAGNFAMESVPVAIPKSEAAAPSSPTISSSGPRRDFVADTITVSWTASGDPGKQHSGRTATVTYKLYFAEGARATTSSTAVSVTGTSGVIRNLDDDKSYSVLVVATNNSGLSSTPTAGAKATVAASGASRPSTPAITTTRDFNADTITVRWPASNPGTLEDGNTRAAISSYKLHYAEGDSVTTSSASVPVTGTSGVIRGLDDDKSYSVLVAAISTAGMSSVHATRIVAASKLTAPGKPLIKVTHKWPTPWDLANQSTHSLSVSWNEVAGGTDHKGNDIAAGKVAYQVSWNGGAYEDATSPVTKSFSVNKDLAVQIRAVVSDYSTATESAKSKTYPKSKATAPTAAPTIHGVKAVGDSVRFVLHVTAPGNGGTSHAGVPLPADPIRDGMRNPKSIEVRYDSRSVTTPSASSVRFPYYGVNNDWYRGYYPNGIYVNNIRTRPGSGKRMFIRWINEHGGKSPWAYRDF